MKPRPENPSAASNVRPGFTLLELLSVVAVMAVLMLVAIPAVKNIAQSAGVGTGLRQVSNAMHMARHHAIAHHTTVRVVFVYRDTAWGNIGHELQNVAYATIERFPYLEDGVRGWRYITAYEYLPNGTVFLGGTQAGALDALPNDVHRFPRLGNSNVLDQSASPATNVIVSFTNSPTERLAYIEFDPRGVASRMSTVRIEEGYLGRARVCCGWRTIQTGVVTTVNQTNMILVDDLTGSIRIVRK
jgi:prepilin-type N-terminal cleavage/methylation domain-containing protein